MPGPVHWHEGLFLQPHHLQTMQHVVLDRIDGERRLSFTFPYGVIELKVSADALENMLVRFDRLRAVMPSGIEVNFPENADLPSLDIKQAFEASSNPFTVSLAIPLWYDSRANSIDPTLNGDGAAAGGAGGSGGGNADWRVKRIYKVAEIQRTDENTGENQQPMMIRRLNARLILDDDDHTDLEVLPLLRIAHATGQDVGTARQEPSYIPPCLVTGGSATLRERLRDLSNQVQASRSTLVQQITAGGFTIDAMRGVQFEQAMRLRTLNRYAARLGSLINVANQIRPFEFYLDLRELLGELAAGQPARDKEFQVPEYDHDNLANSFNDLIDKIRSLLGGTVQERFLKIDFVLEGGVLVLQKPLDQETLEKPTDYFLGIKTHEDHAAVAKLVEDGDKFKLMAKSMIQQRIWGIKLQEERHPPLTLPAKGDLYYYRLMRGESQRMWDRIKDEKMMAARWPDMQTSDFQLALYMPIP
ncbi:MAG TPA: type VI secretion system baseplate subunit TssK [Phycisphaerae bacterium]|nr:type VI secretion system baseplate subunit TssK [Phycisphaerae bacterium]